MGKDVLIIGGGVIGLCSAYYASQQGHRVTVLERGKPDHGGCSFGNAGMIVPSHFVPLAAPGMVALGLKWMWNPESPFYIKPRLDLDLLRWGWGFFQAATAGRVRQAAPLLRDLHMASRACFEQLQSRPDGAFGLAQNGLLMLCQSQHALDEEAAGAAKARDLGIPAEVLDAAQTAKLDPGVRMNVAGSVYYPKDCHLAPSRFMAALRRHLDAAKTKFLWETEVTGCRTESGKILALATNRGEVSAEEYVLAGGIWSSGLSAGLGLRLPMQAGKGYSLTLPQPRDLPRICSILTEARIAVTPMDGKLRVGGTMEISGLSEQVSPRRVQGIINAFPRYFPNFKTEDFRDLPVWHGLRPCSPDGLPYIGRPKKFSNLVVAAGHAMMGLSLGPVTGKLVAELLSGEKPSINLSLLKPDRY